MSRKPAETVTLNEFAADWGVTVRTVTNWIAEGMPHRAGGKGQRRVVRSEANAWVREREREAAEAESDAPADLAEAERRYQLARAEKVELEVRRARGELVTVEEAAAPVEAMLAQLRAQMVTIPQRWAPTLLACKALPEITGKLDGLVAELMTTLAADDDDPTETEEAA